MKVVWKCEDEIDGVSVGPAWTDDGFIQTRVLDGWVTRAQAKKYSESIKASFEEY